jgi:4-diphosphocytidyl-2-C-methyl-D-erythritol kinase
VVIDAPAKLNVSLYVGDRRPDGFHDIESLFLALAWGDTLCFETSNNTLPPEIYMNWQIGGKFPLPPPIAPQDNIIFKAVSLFAGRTGYDTGLTITVDKRIPPGGGLGGGASNAAAALLALNRLASPGSAGLLDRAALAEMGAELGSDVPFFLHETAAALVCG